MEIGFKNNTLLGIVISMAGIVSSNASIAEYQISFASGYGAAHIVPLRIGFVKSWDAKWYQECEWFMGGYSELSVYNLHGKAGLNPASNSTLQATAAAGVFRLECTESWKNIWPYFDVGFGASYLSKKEIGGRELGSNCLFEDRIGFGFRFGEKRQFDISYRAIHFSNAYLAEKNAGINLHLIVLGYWF